MRQEEFLPQNILQRANGLGEGELAWKPEDVASVVEAACQAGMAGSFGSFQFRPSGLTCDVWWIEFHAEKQRFGEGWNDYVKRSTNELYEAFRKTLSEVDFEEEAHWFEGLETKMDRGENVLESLYVLLYFRGRDDFFSHQYLLPHELYDTYLPSELIARSGLIEGRYVWKMKDVEDVISAAESLGLANIGGPPVVKIGNETQEFFSLGTTPDGRSDDEAWNDFVVRSADEVRARFQSLIADPARTGRILRELLPEEITMTEEELMKNLWFLLSFEIEGENAGQGWYPGLTVGLTEVVHTQPLIREI